MTDVQRLDIEGNSKLDELTFIYSPNRKVEKNMTSVPILSNHRGPDEYPEEKSSR